MKSKFIIIPIAIISAALAGLIFWSVIRHKEAGLMQVCWPKGSGYAEVDAKVCPNGQPQALTWPIHKFPLKVLITVDAPYIETVLAAIDLWNKEVCPLFTTLPQAVNSEATIERSANILIKWGEKVNNAAGYTRFFGKNGNLEQAFIVLSEPSDLHAVYRFAAHELGHALGLAHDTAKRSIMNPIQPEATEEISFVLPSDYDIRLLKERYCN